MEKKTPDEASFLYLYLFERTTTRPRTPYLLEQCQLKETNKQISSQNTLLEGYSILTERLVITKFWFELIMLAYEK